MNRNILILDLGTTGIRACVMDESGSMVASAYRKVTQFYPQPGWVEQDANEHWELTRQVMAEVAGFSGWDGIQAIGITNQRETVIAWDAETSQPIHPAIVWQCRRTAQACESLKHQGKDALLLEKTGLVVDPYFSATKIAWLMDNAADFWPLVQQARLRVGTVDSWILWQLSGGQAFKTDWTNASRTQLMNIHTRQWDNDLLCLFGIPKTVLPEIAPVIHHFGNTIPELTGGKMIPIQAMAGDQQAALFGQRCWQPDMVKCTFGTGAFLVKNIGLKKPAHSSQGLLTTLAVDGAGEPVYALEGSVFMAGGAIEWLMNQLGLCDSAQVADELASSVPDSQGVVFVPALTGLGAPYWDSQATGTLMGLTRGSHKAHFIRAAYEAIAFQTYDILSAMGPITGTLLVDGGVTQSSCLMQCLADILGIPVVRSVDPELTARGIGYLAGLGAGIWPDAEAIPATTSSLEAFTPRMSQSQRESMLASWRRAVACTLTSTVPNTATYTNSQQV
jgi:glycerol kinase